MLVFIQIPFKYKNQDVSVCLGSSNQSNTKPFCQSCGSHLHLLKDTSLPKPNLGLHLGTCQARRAGGTIKLKAT